MNKVEIIANCIDDVRSGRSTIQDCLARYPELGEELTSSLRVISGLRPDMVSPSPEFNARAKRYMFAPKREIRYQPSHRVVFWPRTALMRVLASGLVGALCLGSAGGTVFAAQNSLPGDTLYPVKIGVENFQIAVTPGAAAKASLHVQLAQRRINEAVEQVKLNREVDTPALKSIQHQIDSAIKELGKTGQTEDTSEVLSRLSVVTLNQHLELEQVLSSAPDSSREVLKQAMDETSRGNTIAQVAYSNHDFLQRQPSVADSSLDIGQFHIEGVLQNVNNTNWNVGGTVLEKVHYSGNLPKTGSRVKIDGLVKDGQVFISRCEITSSPNAETRIEGQFGGIDQNGKANVSGLHVDISTASNEHLNTGDRVELLSKADNGKMKVTGKESDQSETGNTTSLNGILTGVSLKDKTITVRVAGNQILIDISNARLSGKQGALSTMSDLERFVGKDIKVSGLSKKGNSLLAGGVLLDERD